MKFLSFLNQRETGIKRPFSSSTNEICLNLDPVLSRLVCWRKNCHVIQGHEFEVPPFACKFNKDANSTDLLAVANEDGDILLYDTFREGSQALLKTFRAHHNAIFDISWLPGKSQLITVSGDHFAALWNAETSQCISTFQKHVGSVKSVDVCPTDNAVFATGSRDGSINVWDTRINLKNSYGNCYKSAMSINDAHSRKEKLQELSSSGVRRRAKSVSKTVFCSVTAVAFQDRNNLASAGVADGVVKIWDLRKTYNIKDKHFPIPRYEMSYCKQKTPAHGCTSLVFDSNHRNLYACSTSSVIHKFDCHSHDCFPKSSYKGFRGSTYFIKLALSSDDQYLLCGSSDEKAYIWKVSKPGIPIFQLSGHTAEVTSVAWNQNDISKLVTCGDDNQIHIWKSFGDMEGMKTDDEVLATCSSYAQSGDHYVSNNEDDSSLMANIAEDLGQREIDANLNLKSSDRSSVEVKKRRASSITNFFTPTSYSVKRFASSGSPQELQKHDLHNKVDVNVAGKASQENEKCVGELSPSNPSVNSQILSPCKVLNVDNRVSPSHVQRSLFLGANVPSSSRNFKENNAVKDKTTTKSVQPKRKCPHTVPRVKSRKLLSGKKTMAKNFAQKQRLSTEGTLMNYFCVELSPDKK